MFGYDWPRLHAALNDLPAALLFVTVLFEIASWITKRESLRNVALWTLWAGVIGGWAAVVAGLQAEEVIDHGGAIHELMEPHETLALFTMGVFTVVLAHKLFRRGQLSGVEEWLSRTVSFAGLLMLLWTAWLGGKMYFEHAAGVPTSALAPEIRDRGLGKPHEHGGEGHEHGGEAHEHEGEHEH